MHSRYHKYRLQNTTQSEKCRVFAVRHRCQDKLCKPILSDILQMLQIFLNIHSECILTPHPNSFIINTYQTNDNTTIQDIVDELGGLSKGAIYHHFKSKEEIMDALGDRMFFHNNPFEKVRARTDLNGLQKMRMAVMLNQSDEKQIELTKQAIPMLKNPHVLARMIETNRRCLCPYWEALIEEGIQDGSIQTQYKKELAEFLVLMDIWLIPSIFPAAPEDLQNRIHCIGEMLQKMGLPLLNEEIDEKIASLPYYEE